MTQEFLHVFILLFFALNALGVMPIFLSLTQEMGLLEKQDLINKATLTALVVGFVFSFGGGLLLDMLGITKADFQIGGGIILFLIATSDLVFAQEEKRRNPRNQIGVVPIGVPMILGPGSMTTLMIVQDKSGIMITLLALTLNIGIIFLVFRYSHLLVKLMGKAGARAFGKIASLFLVAIAIRMIRVGVEDLIRLF